MRLIPYQTHRKGDLADSGDGCFPDRLKLLHRIAAVRKPICSRTERWFRVHLRGRVNKVDLINGIARGDCKAFR